MPMLEDGKVTTNRGMLAYSREGAYRIIVLRFLYLVSTVAILPFDIK